MNKCVALMMLWVARPVLGQTEAAPVPVPLSTEFVPPLLMVLVWLLVAAAIVGPLVRFYRAEPASGQSFSDDPPARTL